MPDLDLESIIKNAYLAGFADSAQGWNGEHPGTDDQHDQVRQDAEHYAQVVIRVLGLT